MASKEQEAHWDYLVARRRVIRDPSLANVTAYNTTLLAAAHVLDYADMDDDVLKIHRVERRFREADRKINLTGPPLPGQPAPAVYNYVSTLEWDSEGTVTARVTHEINE